MPLLQQQNLLILWAKMFGSHWLPARHVLVQLMTHAVKFRAVDLSCCRALTLLLLINVTAPTAHATL